MRASESGFALIEAIAALGVIAVISGMFLMTVQSSAQARRHVEQVRAGTLVARSRLDQAVALARFDASGRDGAFDWSARVAPYAGAANGPGLQEVTVTVSDHASGAPVAQLRTLRLAR